MEDITERKQREQLQEYLVKLNDAPSPLSDSLEIQRAATRVLGETLHVDRVMYSEIGDNKTTHNILDNYVREGVSKIIGRLPISRFSEYTDRIKGGKAFVVYDMKVDEH